MSTILSQRPVSHVLWGKLDWHPAVAAWRQLAADAPDPERVEVLRDDPAAAAYRLVGAGPGGAPIIARRTRLMRAKIERALYERVLPHLRRGAPRFCGFKPDGPELAWVFLAPAAPERTGA